jgi:hypothetical protein
VSDFQYDLNTIWDIEILKDLVQNVALTDKMQKQIIDKYFKKNMTKEIRDLFYLLSMNCNLTPEHQIILSKDKDMFLLLAHNSSLIPEVQMKIVNFIIKTIIIHYNLLSIYFMKEESREKSRSFSNSEHPLNQNFLSKRHQEYKRSCWEEKIELEKQINKTATAVKSDN